MDNTGIYVIHLIFIVERQQALPYHISIQLRKTSLFKQP